MSKITVAFGSLAIVSLLLGIHTSTLAQPPVSSSLGDPPIMELPPSTPVVPPLPEFRQMRTLFRNGTQPLDGLNCEECTFENMTLEYSGGAYRLAKCRFKGTIRVVFKGAAANAIALLPLAEAITSRKPPSGPSPLPQPRILTIAKPIIVDWISPQTVP